MSRSDSTSRQRGKMLLIPILLLVLGYFLWDGNAKEEEPAGEVARESAPLPPSAGPGRQSGEELSWPAMKLKSILAHNPFAPLAVLPEPEPADPEPAEPVSLPSPAVKPKPPKPPTLPVQAILQGPKGRGALVAGKLIHVGDTLEDGWQVVAIDADGILVKPAGGEAKQEE